MGKLYSLVVTVAFHAVGRVTMAPAPLNSALGTVHERMVQNLSRKVLEARYVKMTGIVD